MTVLQLVRWNSEIEHFEFYERRRFGGSRSITKLKKLELSEVSLDMPIHEYLVMNRRNYADWKGKSFDNYDDDQFPICVAIHHVSYTI